MGALKSLESVEEGQATSSSSTGRKNRENSSSSINRRNSNGSSSTDGNKIVNRSISGSLSIENEKIGKGPRKLEIVKDKEEKGQIKSGKNRPWHCCVHSKTGHSLIGEKEVLTFLLAGIGGFCDTITFLKGNHTFSGHVTGNIVVFFASYFGSPLSSDHDIDYIHLLIIPQFAFCVALAGRITYRYGPEFLLLLMGIILCIAGILPIVKPTISPYAPSLVAVVAMAFQNAFNDLHQSAVHMKTTIVTGTLTRISLVLSNMLCFGTCMNAVFGSPSNLITANGKSQSLTFEELDSVDQNHFLESYISNTFLLKDEYFEPNPILFNGATYHKDIIDQTKEKAFGGGVNTTKKFLDSKSKSSQNQNIKIDSKVARDSSTSSNSSSRSSRSSSGSKNPMTRGSSIKMLPSRMSRMTMSVQERKEKMINLPVAATYNFEDLCGPALGMFGFVCGCALGSFMGVYFDLRGLLLPGGLLLVTWLYLHYHCHCSCGEENEEDHIIQEEEDDLNAATTSSSTTATTATITNDDFNRGISLSSTSPSGKGKGDNISTVTILESHDENEENEN